MAGDTEKTPEEIKADEAKKAEEAAKNAEAEKVKMVPHQALHAEREEHKKTKERLDALEAEKVAASKKAEEEKGNFEKLYKDEQEKNKSLLDELTGTKTKLTDFETAAKTRIEKSIETIKNVEDKAIVTKLLEGKSFAEQENILPKLVEKFGTPSNVNSGAAGGNEAKPTEVEAKRKEAESKGDVLGLIANAPIL